MQNILIRDWCFFVIGILLYLSITVTAQQVTVTPSIVWLIYFYAAMMIIFMMSGGGFATIPAYWADIFGTKYVGMLYGIVFVSHQIGSFLGAYLSGVFYELNGNFDYAWYGSIALSIFAGLIHLPIKEIAIERIQTA